MERGCRGKDYNEMQWSRANSFGLSRVACQRCRGLGVRPVWKLKQAPCGCVLRAVFRACFTRYRECVELTKYCSSVSLEYAGNKDGGRVYGRKIEEYMADVCLIAKRTLSEEEHQAFRFHFLLGADWKLCAKRLNLNRGNFYHMVYRIEEKLGRAFAELEPYPLYPVADYFSGTVRRARARSRVGMAETWEAQLPLTA